VCVFRGIVVFLAVSLPVPPLIAPVPLPFPPRLVVPALRYVSLRLYGVINIAPLRGLFACGVAAVFFLGGIFFYFFGFAKSPALRYVPLRLYGVMQIAPISATLNASLAGLVGIFYFIC